MRTLSSLLGREVATESGRRLGHCHDLRGEIRGSRVVVTAIAVGAGGILERVGVDRALGGRAREVPWEAVSRIEGRRIVVRDGTEVR